MRNVLLTLAFDGTAYHGWQVQENSVTVQQTLQDAWEKICQSRDNVVGCSRTDSGVHAKMYCCNIRTETAIPCRQLIPALNSALPDDIAVTDCKEIDFDFHARYDCAAKEYIYIIRNSQNRDPFDYKYSLHYKYPLDAQFLATQAAQFVGTHDFSAFCAAGSSVQSNVRTVYSATVYRDGENVIFKVSADGFLYNMVRIMVGTLLSIAQGKIEPDTIGDIIESRQRDRAGFTAAAHGLYLNKVDYAGRDSFESSDN